MVSMFPVHVAPEQAQHFSSNVLIPRSSSSSSSSSFSFPPLSSSLWLLGYSVFSLLLSTPQNSSIALLLLILKSFTSASLASSAPTMKSSVLSLVFVAALAAAQDGIPSCATGCITKFTTGTSIAGCQQLDVGCICKNADFINDIACCLSSACDKAGQDQAVDYAKQICSSSGVSTPDQVVCKENSSSQSETAASDTSASPATTGSSSTPATSDSASKTTATTGSSATTGSQTGSSATSTSSNVAAPLASAGSLVGAAIAMLAAVL
ncbi:hypothetical protein V8C37DRAFT_392934 [Trichoderma ceciliae]